MTKNWRGSLSRNRLGLKSAWSNDGVQKRYEKNRTIHRGNNDVGTDQTSSNNQLFAGQTKPITIGFFDKENPDANHENCCALRESFHQEQWPESRNSTASLAGVRQESR